ncbi:hypothetical protein HDV05_003363 [Chytridiales sp. JEL 0842]|nr:hypothetical protein HDV05_003363 [Chytridiales sp. JEL 0842]
MADSTLPTNDDPQLETTTSEPNHADVLSDPQTALKELQTQSEPPLPEKVNSETEPTADTSAETEQEPKPKVEQETSNAAVEQETKPESQEEPKAEGDQATKVENVEDINIEDEDVIKAAGVIQGAWRRHQGNKGQKANKEATDEKAHEGPITTETTTETDEKGVVDSNEQNEKQDTSVDGVAVEEKPKTNEITSDLNQWLRKRYMGGYRDKRSGVEYFHACSQTPTPQEIRDLTAKPKFHRDTQTKFLRSRKTEVKRDSSTQMEKPGIHISTANDHVLKPRQYITAEEHHEMIVRKVIVIQCFIRRCFASRLAKQLRKERDARLKAIAAKERRRKELSEKKHQKEVESRLHPRTTKDFEILYNGLENWRIQETEKINAAGYSEPARLAALADLLDQEAVLIQKIDRLRVSAADENKEKAVVKLLDLMASPKRWPVYKGGYCHVDTPNTVRARELRDLYHALNAAALTIDERLQILLHVKYTVKEFDCNLTREIVDLIDREGDLVSRGRDPSSLEGLRKRIANLFLQFIQTPEFNPEATLHQKFPGAHQAWKRDQAVYYCRGCTKYLPSTEFYLSTTLKHLGRCKSCTVKENIANQRKDDSCYADMMRYIKAQESAKRLTTFVPEDAHYNALALLQESDLRHLVDAVWNRQSCISGSRTMEDLVLTRWDQRQEWSPWNCLLLTKAEAEKHDTGSDRVDPSELYSEEFVRKVKQRQMAARRHFAELPAMERHLRKYYVEDGHGRLMMKALVGSVSGSVVSGSVSVPSGATVTGSVISGER